MMKRLNYQCVCVCVCVRVRESEAPINASDDRPAWKNCYEKSTVNDSETIATRTLIGHCIPTFWHLLVGLSADTVFVRCVVVASKQIFVCEFVVCCLEPITECLYIAADGWIFEERIWRMYIYLHIYSAFDGACCCCYKTQQADAIYHRRGR